MQLGAATGSLVMGGLGDLLKNKNIVSEAGKDLSFLSAGSPYGALAGMAFNTLATKLPGMIDDIRRHLAEPSVVSGAAGAGSGATAANVLQQPMMITPQNTGALTAYMNQFDTDKNGVLSKTELENGIQQLRQQAQALAAKGPGMSAQDASQLRYLRGMTGTLSMMDRQYNTVAGLDGSADGISTADVQKLSAGDGNTSTVSLQDWRQLALSSPIQPAV